MSRTSRVAGFLLVPLVTACATPQPPTSLVNVSDKLKAGANESLAMIVPAKGVQIYECRAKDQVGGYRGRRGAQGRLLSSRGRVAGAHQLHGRLLLLHREVSWRVARPRVSGRGRRGGRS
jgi:hypothetical protein